MNKYQCHKRVKAFQITAINLRSAGDAELTDSDGMVRIVSTQYVLKHKPEVGGYFVLYEDGYESFSPSKAFEEGYSMVPETPIARGNINISTNNDVFVYPAAKYTK